MLLSVVIPAKNEAANIAAALGAFDKLRGEGLAETVVVDNFSSDATADIARGAGARVFLKGPERCAQRNLGAKEARGEWLMFVDADMIVPEETQREILRLAESGGVDALYVREVRSGRGLRAKARNFERSFYDATPIDGLRAIRKTLFDAIGGYDENLTACEDWDLDIRLKAAGARTAITSGHLVHNEKALSLRKLLSKKRYYSGTADAYLAKWRGHPDAEKQFSPAYRYFGVFAEKGKWRKILRHPVLFAAMYFERILVGFTYVCAKLRGSRARR